MFCARWAYLPKAVADSLELVESHVSPLLLARMEFPQVQGHWEFPLPVAQQTPVQAPSAQAAWVSAGVSHAVSSVLCAFSFLLLGLSEYSATVARFHRLVTLILFRR